jgi:EAL domain-containing protein (putative c-di-GMP-specific phosphodiesterase class I)
MAIEISSIFVWHEDKQYVVYPRAELITDCLSSKRIILELLSTVKDGHDQVCPVQFFSELSEKDTYMIYCHSLDSLRLQMNMVATIKLDIKFIKSFYTEMLLAEFSGETIIFQLKETSTSHRMLEIRERLHQLRENLRVQIWLDDFGTERSNFDLLNIIKFDGIKVSKELFWDFYPYNKPLLKYMLAMLKTKSGSVIVEGIDSFDKYIFCKEHHCMMQGYFFDEVKKSSVV